MSAEQEEMRRGLHDDLDSSTELCCDQAIALSRWRLGGDALGGPLPVGGTRQVMEEE